MYNGSNTYSSNKKIHYFGIKQDRMEAVSYFTSTKSHFSYLIARWYTLVVHSHAFRKFLQTHKLRANQMNLGSAVHLKHGVIPTRTMFFQEPSASISHTSGVILTNDWLISSPDSLSEDWAFKTNLPNFPKTTLLLTNYLYTVRKGKRHFTFYSLYIIFIAYTKLYNITLSPNCPSQTDILQWKGYI